MPITVTVLYRDSFYFLRNNLASILLLILSGALINVMLNLILLPDNEQLKILSAIFKDISSQNYLHFGEIFQNMSPEERMVLLKAAVAETFSSLVGNVLLAGGLLTLISLVSQGRRVSALQAISLSVPILPRLSLLIFTVTVLIQFGLSLWIVPGIAIAVAVSLTPVIIANEKTGVFISIKNSAKLAFANVHLIVPAIILWLVAKLLLLLVARLLAQPPMAISLILSITNNMISALLLVYLFRLYMLLRNE